MHTHTHSSLENHPQPSSSSRTCTLNVNARTRKRFAARHIRLHKTTGSCACAKHIYVADDHDGDGWIRSKRPLTRGMVCCSHVASTHCVCVCIKHANCIWDMCEPGIHAQHVRLRARVPPLGHTIIKCTQFARTMCVCRMGIGEHQAATERARHLPSGGASRAYKGGDFNEHRRSKHRRNNKVCAACSLSGYNM